MLRVLRISVLLDQYLVDSALLSYLLHLFLFLFVILRMLFFPPISLSLCLPLLVSVILRALPLFVVLCRIVSPPRRCFCLFESD